MTDRRVFRYRLPITDHVVLEMPTGAEVLSVGPPRDGFDELDLWAVVDTSVVTEQDRRFRIVGTGNPMPDDCGRFIGTVPTHGGSLIWHVFEVAR
jgi:hypothetical protein